MEMLELLRQFVKKEKKLRDVSNPHIEFLACGLSSTKVGKDKWKTETVKRPKILNIKQSWGMGCGY